MSFRKVFLTQKLGISSIALLYDQLHHITNYSQVEFLIELLQKKENYFVFVLRGRILALNT